jgi:ATP-dependent Zn protease
MPWIAIGIFLAIFLVPSLLSGDQGDEITYTEFIALVDAGDVATIEVENGSLKITGELRDGSKFQATGGGDSGLISNDVDEIR